MKNLAIFLVLVFACACSSPSREDINAIKLIDKKDLVKCQAIDAVEGNNDKGIESLAIEMAKLKALKLQADAIYIQDSVANGSQVKILATAYSCK